MKHYRILKEGEKVWWVQGTTEPIWMTIDSTSPDHPAQYLIRTPYDIPYWADVFDLFETEKEALEAWFGRANKELDDKRAALARLEKKINSMRAHYEAITEQHLVKNWSTVTTHITLAGESAHRRDITVVGDGVFEIKDGAVVDRLTVMRGGKCHVYGSTINDVCVYKGGYIYLYDSSLMADAEVKENGIVHIHGHAELATVLVFNKGIVAVYNNGSVTNAEVTDNGEIHLVDKTASIKDSLIGNGGQLHATGGAYIDTCTIDTGGKLIKEPPYNIDRLTIKEGADI